MKKTKEKYKNIAGGGIILFFAAVIISTTLWDTIILRFFGQFMLLVAIVAGILYLKEPDT